MENSSSQQTNVSTTKSIITGVVLCAIFLCMVAWFDIVDVYHQHFFQTGPITLAYNAFRSLFALFILWILYSTGYLAMRLCVGSNSLKQFSTLDRFILGFGSGAAIWHIGMYALGEAHLYYQAVMAFLCMSVLALSARHFNEMRHEIRESFPPLRPNGKIAFGSIFTTVAIFFALIWLLALRGLYPSGGGDYYTHYFYYYLQVIKSHGLAPNDVWYHYYYSKGAGLYFLGMLLTDPEAPAIITFCFVTTAALALRSIIEKISPRTLWPLVCPLLYIIYNLVGLSNNGGEFQKIHEVTTALTILCIWAVCMYDLHSDAFKRPMFLMLAGIMIAGAILTPAFVVFFAFFFALQLGLALIHKNWQRAGFFFFLSAISTISVLSVLLINYLVTGLATDQAINLTWKFANIERLNNWGVLPNIMMVAWIRDNYDSVATPYGFQTVQQLVMFTRANYLWVLLAITALIICIRILKRAMRNIADRPRLPVSAEMTEKTRIFKLFKADVLLLIFIFGVLSVIFGHSQEVSYFRFSSFFFPLLTLICVLYLSSLYSSKQKMNVIMPLLLVFLVVHSWPHWTGHMHKATRNAFRFMKGKYSLAEAYRHQPSGVHYGGIHMGVYNASQQVPKGSRIWSTNVDSYCMAPDCIIESTISFKMSSNLSDILSGTPAEAKAILQREKLNYFIFSKESTILDLLPYSALFSPKNLAENFGILWTDGKTYLLTWKGSNTRPLDEKFLRYYKQKLITSRHPWFRFNEAIPAMQETMRLLNSENQPAKPIDFPWRKTVDRTGIQITRAIYGKNCTLQRTFPYYHSIHQSIAPKQISHLCAGKQTCKFTVSTALLGDTARGCEKDFRLSYQCEKNSPRYQTSLLKEANGKSIIIDCHKKPGINIVSATYGNNCHIKSRRPYLHFVPPGNASMALQKTCSGKMTCRFVANDLPLGDPAPNCSKDLKIDYFCAENKKKLSLTVKSKKLGDTVTIGC